MIIIFKTLKIAKTLSVLKIFITSQALVEKSRICIVWWDEAPTKQYKFGFFPQKAEQ